MRPIGCASLRGGAASSLSTRRASTSGTATTSAMIPAAISATFSPNQARQRQHRHRGDGVAEKSGEGVHRKGAAEPVGGTLLDSSE